MARIAIGGFQHETNTFAPIKATFQDFAVADGWPALTKGKEILSVFRGMNLPMAGFIDRAIGTHDLVPLLWCSASPSAQVEREAYENIAGELIEMIEKSLPIDALFLDLHGAMVAEHLEDGEGELLRRIRAKIGSDIPIVVSLDLHANITDAMVHHSDTLVVCRTYPHVDLSETGERSYEVLNYLLSGRRLAKAFRKPNFLIPLTWQCTLIDPAQNLYRDLEILEQNGAISASLAFGFPPADIKECGPAILVYAEDSAKAEKMVDHFLCTFNEAEKDFAGKIWQPREAVAYAKQRSGPVILADTQDNPGAGGNSDTVGLLEALVEERADAVFANLCDPRNAEIAHRAGLGAEVNLEIGAWSGMEGHRPFQGTFHVRALGDGDFMATGPFYRGNRMQLGPMACLEIGKVKIVLTSRKQQAADQAMLRHLHIEPKTQHILALKSSVHFRADFQPIAKEILIVTAPGANPVDNRDLPYQRLRRGLRLMPMQS